MADDDIDNNESAREPPATPREFQGDCQGAVMFDASCRIAHVTPAAEKFLGWRNDDVVGAHCQSIFDCRDTLGDSLCTRCGLKLSLERGEDVPGMLARVKDCHAQWHEVNTTFLYLDSARYVWQPRVIGVLHGLGSLPHQLPFRHPTGSKAVKWPAP